MKEHLEHIGRKIREAREAAGLTQARLGKVLGYSAMGISYFENGLRAIKISDLQKIAGHLRKDLQFFLPAPSPSFFRVGPGEDLKIVKAVEAFGKFLEKKK